MSRPLIALVRKQVPSDNRSATTILITADIKSRFPATTTGSFVGVVGVGFDVVIGNRDFVEEGEGGAAEGVLGEGAAAAVSSGGVGGGATRGFARAGGGRRGMMREGFSCGRDGRGVAAAAVGEEVVGESDEEESEEALALVDIG